MDGLVISPSLQIVRPWRCQLQCRCWRTSACTAWRLEQKPAVLAESALRWIGPKLSADCKTDPRQPEYRNESHPQRAWGVECRPSDADSAESTSAELEVSHRWRCPPEPYRVPNVGNQPCPETGSA